MDKKDFVYGSAINDGKLGLTIDTGLQTLYDFFLKGMTDLNNGECLGTRKDGNSPYQWYTYADVMSEARNFGSGLHNIGLKRGIVRILTIIDNELSLCS